MSIVDKLEQVSKQEPPKPWRGTFREFLRLFETNEFKNLGVLSHKRVYNMVLSAGTEKDDYYGKERLRYNFFEDNFFGMRETIDQIMSYCFSAAQRTETSRRMLLLYGPPSSGKSDLIATIKRGLEQYTKTDEGAVFALEGSDMNENPLLLVPHSLRKEFEKTYNIPIEGELSPTSRYRLENEFNGDFMQYPVERIFFSEANRVGIGTWLPSDPKGQDISELLGSIDMAKIQKIGSEADPNAYNFDGEFFAANRGVMEYIEGLKADERFLRCNLTATQEKSVKAPRFGLLYLDTFIVMHTNEEEFRGFMNEKKYEAYHDRTINIPAPYCTEVSEEVKLYEKLLRGTDVSDIHIAPYTLKTAAMFAIMSRLEPPAEGEDLTLIQKMKLYDKEQVKGHKIEEVADIKKRCKREGMSGVSPRFVIDQIVAAISRAKVEERSFVTSLDILRQLNKAVDAKETFSSENKTAFKVHLSASREEWNDLLSRDIQKAFYVSFKEEAKNLVENYIDQIEAATSGTKLRDPITDEEVDPDEVLMESIEDHIGITNSGRDDFRNEILRMVGQLSRKNRSFDYTSHATLRLAIEKQLFHERKNIIRMTTTTRNPDKEQLKKINEVIERLTQDDLGYTAASANELVKYANAHLFDK